jgi:hypothetical protein
MQRRGAKPLCTKLWIVHHWPVTHTTNRAHILWELSTTSLLPKTLLLYAQWDRYLRYFVESFEILAGS